MIDRSSAYDQAITARRCRFIVRATFDLSDPDAVVSDAVSSAQGPYSQIARVYHEFINQTDCKLVMLEPNCIQLRPVLTECRCYIRKRTDLTQSDVYAARGDAHD